MNKLLDIKMKFNSENNLSKPGPRNLNKKRKTTSISMKMLLEDLKKVKAFYSHNDKYIEGVLIDAYYNDIISKSGRMIELLRIKGDCNDTIVGARFSNAEFGKENHIITHYVSMDVVNDAIKKLELAINFVDEELNGEATSENFDSELPLDYSDCGLSKTKLRDVVIDCSVVEHFEVPKIDVGSINDAMIVTFYETELNIYELLNSLGIDGRTYYYSPAGKNSISVTKDTLEKLVEKVPYLISMTASDISQIPLDKHEIIENQKFTIPSPEREPIIGVIDTLFSSKVYFNEWVDYREVLNDVEKHTITDDNYVHGTSISSLIVDGPTLNPWLDDGCGRFRVRHFGVCTNSISSSRLVKKIENIIANNLDIHVWNLSLGTVEQVSKNFISFDGAALDELQQKYNVLFIVAGTNDVRSEPKNPTRIRVGSPADSINSIVVNSVKKNGLPASYSRNGKILSFFNKPDVSYYGGDFDERIFVYSSLGLDEQYGTSFAAPWISRKVCYLIDVLGFPRELAKALIIDAAAGWNFKQGQYKFKNIIGYGIVPKKIDDIVSSDNSEIKFTLSDMSNAYKTSNYSIPVPKDEGDKSYYIARAMLCYFPECNRLQGVDYTQRELSLKLGVVNGFRINDINYNTQDEFHEYNDERTARKEFRKWENTKFISSLFREKNFRGRKTYNEGFWGISLTSKERRKIAKKDNLRFGIVVTLKNIKGENRISEFKHSCLLRGYIVNDVNIDNKIDIYNSAQEEIKFE